MTFFQFNIGAKARNASRLIGLIRTELVKALVEQKEHGVTRQAVAAKLAISRSELDDQLIGKSCLNLRQLSDLAWALDRELTFQLTSREIRPGQNLVSEPSTMSGAAPTIIGAHPPSSTLPSRPQTVIVPRHQLSETP